MKQYIIIFLGPPGVGKGTQAELLSKKLNLPHISTGVMFRSCIETSSELGNKVKTYLDQGKLVPDDLTLELVKDRVLKSDCKNGFILDGFPRTIEQAKGLENLLNKINKELTHSLELVASEEVVLARIQARSKSGSERSDDNLDVAKNRFKVYLHQTAPLSEFYSKLNKLTRINGEGTVSEISARILKIFSR